MTTGAIAELDRSSLGEHVQGPGVAVIHWVEAGNLASHALDRVLEQAARAYPEIRFGVLDIARDERLAREWAVDEVPTLMIHRDGTLLFTGSGEMSAEALDTLLTSALSMDLAAARRAVNGHQGRFILGFQRDSQPIRRPWDDIPERGGVR